jgi:hypothetical protein
MALDEGLLATARRARDRCLDAERDLELARVDYHDAIRRLHAAGGSMREIADHLGLSHQRVHQIVGDEGGSARRRAERVLSEVTRRARKWPFERFTRRAREAVALAEGEARQLGHRYVGTEHVLLGLLSLADEPAARALASLGVRPDTVRDAVVAASGRGEADAARHLPFTPPTKKVLEGALREALALGHDYIGTEHILLGLVRADDAVATRILDDLGAPADVVRAAVASMLRG